MYGHTYVCVCICMYVCMSSRRLSKNRDTYRYMICVKALPGKKSMCQEACRAMTQFHQRPVMEQGFFPCSITVP